jgi:hypothetical protein
LIAVKRTFSLLRLGGTVFEYGFNLAALCLLELKAKFILKRSALPKPGKELEP